ncbi:hypothetical protein JTE90_020668 [Oedothorax gibbosus]|uniref:Uncharacterized protein n=1 Tax=Oedothorax gibbosus TaxID=931172 RepID=A0AAV6USK4_9ARAC|nr:hypothetical protein JTE90_020668 [Oedothorax gibbosus]
MDCSRLCPGKIMCESKRGCYSLQQRCNGVTQCEDASDEKNCVSELCNYENGGFLCNNGRCIQEVWTCDRTDDCGDLSDEKNCLRNSVLTAALMGSLICALLLVIAISCTCRLHALRMLETRMATSRETPLSRLSREFFFREPPPSYAVAVQGDNRRNLCVENLHYGVRPDVPVHRSRRSRRSRHSRCPYPVNTVDRNAPVPGSSVQNPPEPRVEVLSEQTLKVEECSSVSDQSSKVEDCSSVTDSTFVSGDGKCDDTEDDSPVIVGSSAGENVGLQMIASDNPQNLRVGIIGSVDTENMGLEATSTYDVEIVSVGSCDTQFYCDSDTDPLIV